MRKIAQATPIDIEQAPDICKDTKDFLGPKVGPIGPDTGSEALEWWEESFTKDTVDSRLDFKEPSV